MNHQTPGEDDSIAPTIEELVTKALNAQVIDTDTAEELRASEDMEEALGMFFSYVIQEDQGDPEGLLKSWGIIE